MDWDCFFHSGYHSNFAHNRGTLVKTIMRESEPKQEAEKLAQEPKAEVEYVKIPISRDYGKTTHSIEISPLTRELEPKPKEESENGSEGSVGT